MMIIRPICPEELDLFTAFTDQSERNERFHAYLTQMWDEGYIRPEWCFVAEVAGAFIGRIVYWTLPLVENLFEVDFLEVPWDADYLEVGTKLLRSSLPLLQQEHTVIQYVIDTPSPMSTFAAQRLEVIEQSGFEFTRETRRFEWLMNEIIPSQRLVFRSLDDVGEDAFIDAMMRVSENTLDRLLQRQIDTVGLAQSVIEQFQLLQAFKYKSSWWQLAYNQTGVVGLIMPAENDGGAIIGYIGVIPEYRGQGYVHDLLAQGTVTLKAAGARRVRADTDVNNAPMVSAFQKAGYHQFASRQEYRLNYTPE